MDTACKSRTAIESSVLFLGIDVGTSGIRTCVIDSSQTIIDFQQLAFNKNLQTSPAHWWQITQQLLLQLKQKKLTPYIKAISVDGTSGTLLALDCNHCVLDKPIMYNQNVPKSSTPCMSQARLGTCKGSTETGEIEAATKISAFPTLLKALYFQHKLSSQLCKVIHQADWIAAQLSQNFNHSDYHNCLKLGFNSQTQLWHQAVLTCLPKTILPNVKSPSDVITAVDDTACHAFSFNPNTKIVAGTTDSNAAFIASGINQFGHALSSLGTTLVLKVFSPIKIESEKHGVYSHRYKNGWIVSGASNCGAGILKTYFSDQEIKHFSTLLQPEKPTTLDYYPLIQTGERFPIFNPNKQPKLTPMPKDKVLFFQAILEALAKIEQQGYALLEQLGAPKILNIVSAGGGAYNVKWQQIRSQYCQVKISQANQTEASFGTALLALEGYNKRD